MMAGMLEGIRVLELGQALEGPVAGVILADLDCARCPRLSLLDEHNDAHGLQTRTTEPNDV
jgi:hypothetical protein